ncbi:MAG: DNA double-strand break repair nuclease NurA [Candidatus Helarchaeota archaeon]
MNKNNESPFDELPQALVEIMLNKCSNLGTHLAKSFEQLLNNKDEIRNILKDQNLLRNDSEILSSPTFPTTCGVDGSYAIEKLLSTDMVAIAGVAVEGLTPPTEKRYWPRPHHQSEILSIPHNNSTAVIARAIMMCMELELGTKAPHDVIYFDGSLTTPLIYFNQALNKLQEASNKLSTLFIERLEDVLQSYNIVLTSPRTDKIFVGIPKYTTRKEITQGILNMNDYEDRGLLSFILNPGEFIGPIRIQKPQSKWHINDSLITNKEIIIKIINALDNLNIIYYRPYIHFPALRIEISQSIANNKQRIAILFESLKLQCGVPRIIDPYPLYLADRMVKHLGIALPAIRKTATQEMVLKWKGVIGNIYLAMHGYRTEWGK